MAVMRHGPVDGEGLVLEAIGLDDEHTSVYRLLLSTPSADVGEIARAVSMPVPRVQVVVDELERLGLLARQAAAHDRVVASPPSGGKRTVMLERHRRNNRGNNANEERALENPPGAQHRDQPALGVVLGGAHALRQRRANL